MTINNPTEPATNASSPGLADVRARRVEIAELIGALQTEDRELANVEIALLRLADMAKVIPPHISPSPASMAASTPRSAAIAVLPLSTAVTTLAAATALPPSPPPAPPVKASPPPAPTPGQDEAEDEDEDDGLSLVDTVKNAMTGKENLQELIVLLMDQSSDTWWTANEIQSYLSEIKGRDVPMRSITFILDNMKDKGLLARDGLNVALPPKASNSD
jgi:hypothetical protein